MFCEHEQRSDDHAAGEQDEGGREVENAERLARLALCLVLLARPGEPELVQALQLTLLHKGNLHHTTLFALQVELP